MCSMRSLAAKSAFSSVTKRRGLTLLVGLWLSSAVSGCGRPATEQECEEIVTRITELELKARGITNSPSDIADTKAALKKDILRGCVGRRISDKALACVRSAKTGQQVVQECF